ncbi:SDR family oxidoreductase [Reyranella sp. CPCC 100927]|uniref:SDR family NAD(P)-dependent oxidoreductase n=1 Tax=Reyranella sp. CPCC 100927 TaxID=2599616 RepID=UPI0011B38DC3|nr:SDR family NAD(P)-dependent oxidoreductase [Reyranella sp. CPCC 100927]TWT03806.1 SDR family NAD(P)-dependent oxidoreductase [Reyranella sp. CPCC 100927]
MTPFRSIVLTGASSGIGAALARDYASKSVRLALIGRDATRLADVATACRDKGADVATATIDITERATLEAWLQRQDAERAVDLVIANAGVALEKGRDLGDGESLRRTMAINVDGTLNTILPLLPAMRARRVGQIGIVSSLAGFFGLPQAAGYNASKAAGRVLAESLRIQLKADKVGVSAICPGFVESAITRGNSFPMPFLMTAERASNIIRRGLAQNRARIAFPLPTKAAVWLGMALPGGLTSRLLGG